MRLTVVAGLLLSAALVLGTAVATSATTLVMASPASAARETHLVEVSNQCASAPETGSAVRVVRRPCAAGGRVVARKIGVYTTNEFYNLTDVRDFQAQSGVHADYVNHFVGWAYPGSNTFNRFPMTRARDVAASGATPQISWDPAKSSAGADQPAFAYSTILSGRHNDYIRQFARDVKAFGSPVVIRFAHEMNLPGSSFSEKRSGNKPGDFVRAWRYVHDQFAALGVKNVAWMWSPNIPSASTTALAGLFPGPSYVDMVGLDGYAYPLEGCRPASSIFTSALRQISVFWKGSVALSEVAVAQECPDKTAWVSSMFRWLDTQPQVNAVMWWNRSQVGKDWRIDSSASARSSFSRSSKAWLRGR